MNYALRLLTLLLVLLPLGACAFEDQGSFLPQPYKPGDKGSNRTSMLVLPDHIVVRQIYGLPEETSAGIVGGVVDALLAQEVIATASAPRQRTSQLHGRLLGDDGQGQRIEWVLLNPSGATVDEFETFLSDEFSATSTVDPALLRRTASTIGQQIAARIAPAGTVARIDPPSQPAMEPVWPAIGPAGQPILITAVFGAPYDGSGLLRRGLRQALLDAGYHVADRPGPDTLQIQATIDASESNPGFHFLSINWELKSPEGKILASIAQANEVPTADLELKWRGLIEPITQGAVFGISDYLSQQP